MVESGDSLLLYLTNPQPEYCQLLQVEILQLIVSITIQITHIVLISCSQRVILDHHVTSEV